MVKYKIKIADENSDIFKEGFKVTPVKQYLKDKEDKGLKNHFFEPIGKKGDGRDKILKNLVQTLIKNGWKIKKG